jgi:hypothetical protein
VLWTFPRFFSSLVSRTVKVGVKTLFTCFLLKPAGFHRIGSMLIAEFEHHAPKLLRKLQVWWLMVASWVENG